MITKSIFCKYPKNQHQYFEDPAGSAVSWSCQSSLVGKKGRWIDPWVTVANFLVQHRPGISIVTPRWGRLIDSNTSNATCCACDSLCLSYSCQMVSPSRGCCGDAVSVVFEENAKINLNRQDFFFKLRNNDLIGKTTFFCICRLNHMYCSFCILPKTSTANVSIAAGKSWTSSELTVWILTRSSWIRLICEEMKVCYCFDDV